MHLVFGIRAHSSRSYPFVMQSFCIGRTVFRPYGSMIFHFIVYVSKSIDLISALSLFFTFKHKENFSHFKELIYFFWEMVGGGRSQE